MKKVALLFLVLTMLSGCGNNAPPTPSSTASGETTRDVPESVKEDMTVVLSDDLLLELVTSSYQHMIERNKESLFHDYDEATNNHLELRGLKIQIPATWILRDNNTEDVIMCDLKGDATQGTFEFFYREEGKNDYSMEECKDDLRKVVSEEGSESLGFTDLKIEGITGFGVTYIVNPKHFSPCVVKEIVLPAEEGFYCLKLIDNTDQEAFSEDFERVISSVTKTN